MKILAIFFRGISVFLLMLSVLPVVALTMSGIEGNHLFLLLTFISVITFLSNSFVYNKIILFFEWIYAAFLLLLINWTHYTMDMVMLEDKELSKNTFIEFIINFYDYEKIIIYFQKEYLLISLWLFFLSLAYVIRGFAENLAFIKTIE